MLLGTINCNIVYNASNYCKTDCDPTCDQVKWWAQSKIMGLEKELLAMDKASRKGIVSHGIITQVSGFKTYICICTCQ